MTSDDHGWSSVTGAMDGGRGPCLVASLGRPVLGPSMKEHFRRVCLRLAHRLRAVSRDPLGKKRKRLKAEFGYDDCKGVGACDRGPSVFGASGRRDEERPVYRVAVKAAGQTGGQTGGRFFCLGL